MPNHLSKRSITIWFGKSDAYINRPRSSLFAWPHQNTRNMTRNILGDRETQSFRSFPLPFMKEMKVKPAPRRRCDLNHSFIRSTMDMPHSYHPMTSIICTKLIKCGPLFLSGFFYLTSVSSVHYGHYGETVYSMGFLHLLSINGETNFKQYLFIFK